MLYIKHVYGLKSDFKPVLIQTRRWGCRRVVPPLAPAVAQIPYQGGPPPSLSTFWLYLKKRKIFFSTPLCARHRRGVQREEDSRNREARAQCFLFSTWVESFSADFFHFWKIFSKNQKYWKIKMRKINFANSSENGYGFLDFFDS